MNRYSLIEYSAKLKYSCIQGTIVINHCGPTRTRLEFDPFFCRGKEVGETEFSHQKTPFDHTSEVDGALMWHTLYERTWRQSMMNT